MMVFIWNEYLISSTPATRNKCLRLHYVLSPIDWKSKAGKSVTLSSTDAEYYYATSEIAKEVIFANNLLEEVGIQLHLPINIMCDIEGAIYLANNHCNSQRSKHIDTRCHFVQEWVVYVS
jgi:hypothetical protein